MTTPIKIFVDPSIYTLTLPYFPDKCLEPHNAGFDLRACAIKDEFSNDVPTRSYVKEGFRRLEDNTVPGFCEYFYIEPLRPYIYNSGIMMEIPEGFYGDVGLRSSAFKSVAMPSNGTVDNSYRGVVKVAFFSYSPIFIQKFARIAQVKIQPYLKLYEMVSEESQLSMTERGDQGFGQFSGG